MRIMGLKSTIEIESDMFAALYNFVCGMIRGTFYSKGLRPTDSQEEDAVLTITSASAEQIQDGEAVLNVFVPDMDNGSGRLVPSKERLKEVSIAMGDVVSVLNREIGPDYEFHLKGSIDTIECADIHQHAVSAVISFNYVTF